jgi:GNAT superfamily N-acetyltransferase
VQVKTDEQICEVQEIWREYLDWSNLMVEREFNIWLDVNAFLSQEMSKLQQFMPPSVRLLLAEYGGRIAGCVCLRKIGEDIGEIKRMYDRPDYRRKGIGLALLETISELPTLT